MSNIHQSGERFRMRRALARALWICSAAVASAAAGGAPASAQLRVVTTSPAYADIANRIGGEHVAATSIMRGPENVHNLRAKPSFIMRVRKADLFVHSGLDAEPWVPQLLKTTRIAKFLPGREGNVDVSRGIALKQTPQRGAVTRAQGDIHVYGNTHYMLDPLNGIVVARTITDALQRADPTHAETFERNFQTFATRLRELTARLTQELAPYRGTRVVTYHRTWPYFLDRFGLRKVAEVEPKPGIAPGPQHLNSVAETMRTSDAKIVIVETWNSKKNADRVAKRAGGKAVVLAQEVNAVPEAGSYEALFEHNVATLLTAFREAGVKPVEVAASTVPSPEQS